MNNKYKVVDTHTVRPDYDDLPKHFLGSSLEEATDIYEQYSDLLNSISYTYYISTGLDKGDLFAEALVGLARAKQDFDDARSDDFIPYAIFRIRDALNEYIRKYASTVSVPSYLKKASRLFERLRNVLETGNVGIEAMFYVLEHGQILKDVPQEIYCDCEDMLLKLNNYADRAEVSYQELISRIQLLPEERELEEWDAQVEDEETVFDTILVKELFEHMTEEERVIAQGIMEDKSYEVIGKELGKSKMSTINIIRNKIVARIFAVVNRGTPYVDLYKFIA